MNINSDSAVIEAYRRLLPIAHKLHKIAEANCNYEESKARATRERNLLTEAEIIAGWIGYKVYHQTDPRGCSLYLVEKREGASANYTNGIAIY
jgi:hypothetical protein